jgi:uncharacterized membrane protein HdeD (DUF308 family)
MAIDYQASPDDKRSLGWMIFLSILLMILGTLAIFSPIVASAFFTSVMGWFTLISGVVMIIGSFVSKPVRGFWLNLIVGIFYVIAGWYILSNLVAAVAVLTLTFGILFIVEGLFTIVIGFTQKAGRSASWLVVLNGVVTLILGILVLNSWPKSALWLIGLYVGISLLFSGISLLVAALVTRRVVSDIYL